MHLVVYESPGWTALAPLTLTRPAALLRCGVTTLLEKHLRTVTPDRLTLWVREPLAAAVRSQTHTLGMPVEINEPLGDGPAVLVDGASLVNGNILPADGLSECFSMSAPDGDLIAARVAAPGLSSADALGLTDRWQSLRDFPAREPAFRRIRHLGDLLDHNARSIATDAGMWDSTPPPPTSAGVTCINAAAVYVHPTAALSPGVVLDASKGPVLIADGAYVGANSVLEGPCSVGPHSRITPLSLIRGGTSVGPVCRVGGEVSNTVFHAYSNKGHDGFIGDSYLGEWVNCGAGTTTSNLKSTYGPVRLTVGPRQIDSGRTLLGAAIGDHAKLGTGTQLSAGAYVGVATMLAISARAAKFVPSFRFITDAGDEPFAVEKAAEVAERMQARRDKGFSDIDRSLLAYAAEAALGVEHRAPSHHAV